LRPNSSVISVRVEGDEAWERIEVPATDCPRIDPDRAQ
jgi:hypothetical protein